MRVWTRIETVAAAVALLLVSSIGQATTGITYYHTDALGSVIAATDESGNVSYTETYRPYGERLEAARPTDEEPVYYTGKTHDDRTGLSYFGARYYDPAFGRFTGIDPADVVPDDPATFNRYAYANNNPYRYVDPDGRAPLALNALKRGVTLDQAGRESGPFAAAFGTTGAIILGVAGAVDTGSDLANPVKGGIKQLTKQIGKRAAKNIPKPGDKVYRVWGEGAGANGRSWSRTDPRTVENYRDAAGLPNQNSGRFVTEGTLTNTRGVEQRDALPLHGNNGGLDELVVPDPAKQIRVDRVSGVNPEF